jgi:hypothetical protein
MKGYIRFVLIEDSCYYLGPNNDPWHNHVARDYLPDTSGTYAQLAYHDSVIVYRNFRVKSDSGWNENRCQIIYWYQNDSLRADSSKPVYQAGIRKVMDLAVDIEESRTVSVAPTVKTTPNPCRDKAVFRFQIPLHSQYTIKIFDVSGRCVRTMTSVSQQKVESATWDLRMDQGDRINAGVYLYTFESEGLSTNGKIVVR